MDIVVWLRSLGLGQYEAAFRENDIDETVLPGLRHCLLKSWLGCGRTASNLQQLHAVTTSHEFNI
jgi:hypothetical protein